MSLVDRILYKEYLEGELEWRKKVSENDNALVDDLLARANKITPQIDYLFQITSWCGYPKEITDLIADMVFKVEDRGLGAQLISALGASKNKKYTPIVIKAYEAFSVSELKKGLQGGVFYDNALARTADKKFLEKYLAWMKEWYHLGNIGSLFDKVCSWGVEDAKDILIKHLSLKEEWDVYNPNITWTPRNQSYVNAMSALSKFKNYDAKIIDAIMAFKKGTTTPNFIEAADYILKKIYKKWGL